MLLSHIYIVVLLYFKENYKIIKIAEKFILDFVGQNMQRIKEIMMISRV